MFSLFLFFQEQLLKTPDKTPSENATPESAAASEKLRHRQRLQFKKSVLLERYGTPPPLNISPALPARDDRVIKAPFKPPRAKHSKIR